MKCTSEITETWFLHLRRTLFEKSQNGKNPIKQEYTLCNQNLDRIEKKKGKKAMENKITEDQGVPMKIREKCKERRMEKED